MLPESIKRIAEDMSGTNFKHIEAVIGGRNSRIFHLKNSEGSYALKFYRDDAKNPKDRFDAETSALNLFAENGMKCVPNIVSEDRENNCILMDWIDGEKATYLSVENINAISGFVKTIHGISKQNNSNQIRFAKEACLNGNEIVKQIKRRLERLEPEGYTYPELQNFLDKEFIPAYKEITNWSREEYLKNSMDFDKDISLEQLTLSPVDIGSHNCLQIDKQLYFLDFEFFGWDDPVKLVADTLQHPGSILRQIDNNLLLNELDSIFNGDRQFQIRLKCLYPLFGLKWCMIMLNPFLSGYLLKDLPKNNIQKEQLFRAKSKTARIVKTIENNLLNHI